MAIGRRELSAQELPFYKAYAIRSVEKKRSQWAVIDQVYTREDCVIVSAQTPKDTPQVRAVISVHKTKKLAMDAA